MPDQRKKPEKSASSNTEDGGVYRIKDVTQSAWEQGKLPLPGLAPNSAPTLTPLNKADEDMAVELAMTGEIPLAVILSALAKEQDAAKKQTPVPVPKDEPEIQPLGQGSYGAGMIRPDEIIAHTPDPPPVAQAAEAPAAAAQPPQKADPKKVKAAKAELEEMAKRAAPPAVATDVTIEKPVAEPQTEVEIKEEPKVEKKEAPKAEKKPAPQQAKKQPAAQKKPAATTPQAAKKPAATAPQAAKKPAATAPQAAKKPAATTPQASK
ncbi:MAG: hypothetical protein LBS96_06835 [Oscillospiraceae bacterium]|jgi:hypothetical protein|nr:hypothetical protein [Oscillospiraceae bacterium]